MQGHRGRERLTSHVGEPAAAVPVNCKPTAVRLQEKEKFPSDWVTFRCMWLFIANKKHMKCVFTQNTGIHPATRKDGALREAKS